MREQEASEDSNVNGPQISTTEVESSSDVGDEPTQVYNPQNELLQRKISTKINHAGKEQHEK